MQGILVHKATRIHEKVEARSNLREASEFLQGFNAQHLKVDEEVQKVALI